MLDKFKIAIQNILLFILAVVLACIFIPIGIFFGMVYLTFNSKKGEFFEHQGLMFRAMAVALDQFGNVACKHLFNACLIKDDTIAPFGNPDETISSVMGRNLVANNLTLVGQWLNKIFNLFQKDHAIKSIGE